MSIANFFRVRRPAYLLIATLSLAYLLTGVSGKSPVANARAQQAIVQTTSGGDVPDAVVNSIASAIGNVEGVEELVVLPVSSDTGRYTVSATVSVPDTAQTKAAEWMSKSTSDFLQGVYSSGEPVDNAQVYYMANGQIVGGAGVGSDVYHQLTAAASTGDTGVVQALANLPTVTDEGPTESWFEVSVPGDS